MLADFGETVREDSCTRTDVFSSTFGQAHHNASFFPPPDGVTMSEVPVLQNRLTMLICPEGSDELRKKQQPSSWILALAKSQTPVLKGFLEMPLDIVFEIASYLHPRDLLNLSRSSKHVRPVFLHRSSSAVWKCVLRKAAGLPECPNDLVEPQYASLMFDTNVCMACSATPDKIICDFGLRLRLCSSCWDVNVVHGTSFCPLVGATDTAFTLVPARGSKKPSSWKNNALNYYFKPELEAAIIEDEHKHKSMSPNEFYKWVDERRVAATRMMQEGTVLDHWYQEWHSTDGRLTKIHNEIQKLGWDSAFFPPQHSKDHGIWNDLMMKNFELDEDGFAEVMRNLSSVYNRSRKEFLTEQLKYQVEGCYRNYHYRLPMEKLVCVPGWKDVSSYPCIKQFIQDRFEDHTKEDLDVLMENIVDEGKKTFVPQFEAILVDAVKLCDPSQKKVSKKRIMGRAINLFFCTCQMCAHKLLWDGFRKVYGYPEIVDHIMRSVVFNEDHWDSHPPSTDIILIQSARDVLKALGLRENSTREEVRNFGDVCCRCGHWRCEKPITFESLVEHVYNQRFWTVEMRKKSNKVRSKEILDIVLFEGHSQRNLASLIHKASNPPDQLSVLTDREISDRRAEGLTISNLLAGTCLFCYHILLSDATPCADEPPEYHVIWKHGLKFEENHFMDRTVLKMLYGSQSSQ